MTDMVMFLETLYPLYKVWLSVTLSYVVLMSFLRAHMSETWGTYIKVFAQMVIFYAVPLMPFVVIWCVWQTWQGSMALWLCMSIMGLVALYLYARVIEPQMLRIHRHDVPLGLEKPLNIVVVADIHVGLFSGYERQLTDIVSKVNGLDDIDAVVFSGDWTYEPGADIVGQLMLLKSIKHPCYHVLGNHDEQEPGPDITAELLHALDILGIKNVENHLVDLGSANLIGVGDLWASKAEFKHFRSMDNLNAKPNLILAHNPDTVDYIPDDLFAKEPLMISGHTHGGQLYIPHLTEYVFKKHSATGFVKDLYQHAKAKVFVTAGTGTVFLPFRLNIPPRIDVLTVR